jgi:hypothetical protein
LAEASHVPAPPTVASSPSAEEISESTADPDLAEEEGDPTPARPEIHINLLNDISPPSTTESDHA